jgi:demethylmenaquinone methyltransferase/2-methoxy-6-polyprenyl-1,4-benzoquinol methylase/phosphoethanolamine N-methyltransferase
VPAQQEIRTRGKVISRLAAFVDFIENLIFLGRLEQIWQRLIDKAELSLGERVVDVGCGTGKVPLLVTKFVLPGGEVFGIDASAEMIAIARKRAKDADVEVEFRRSVMEDLPFPDNCFEVVLSCQALHHVPRDAKIQALSKMQRVLRPGGRLLLLDHGKPYRWYLKILFYPFRWNISEYQAENFRGQVPGMIAGVVGNVEETDRFFGWMRTWKAVKT